MGARMGQQDLPTSSSSSVVAIATRRNGTTTKRITGYSTIALLITWRDVWRLGGLSAASFSLTSCDLADAVLFFEKQKERRELLRRGLGGLAVYGTRVYEPLLSTLWQYTRYAGTLHIACSGMTRSVLDHDIARGWGRRTGPHHSTLVWAS